MEKRLIRILLIEPNRLWRSALSMVISREKDIEVFSEFAHVSDAIGRAAYVQKSDVGVISIDAKSQHNNLAAARKLKEAAPSCHILAVVDQAIAGSIPQALGYIQGFVSCNTESSSLVTYIRRVAGGERIIEPASLAIAAACVPANPFTEREREVLQAIIEEDGQTTRQIAAQFQLKEGTIRNYISNIMHKTDASNRRMAIRIAQERGWL